MVSASEDQSVVNPEPHLVLLYQNSFRQTVKLSDFVEADVFHEFKTLNDATVENLTTLILKTWDQKAIGAEKPSSPRQLRLIHLGRQLEDDRNLQISDLNLTTSDIIHVATRPLDSQSLKRSKTRTSDKGVLKASSNCCIVS